jgi:hypothetical protein
VKKDQTGGAVAALLLDGEAGRQIERLLRAELGDDPRPLG